MGARLATGDVTERESMRAAMSGAEIVVHNAGRYEFGLDSAGKARMHRVNMGGTENVLFLAYELSIPRTLYVSTVAAFGDSGPQPRDETFTRQFPVAQPMSNRKPMPMKSRASTSSVGCPLSSYAQFGSWRKRPLSMGLFPASLCQSSHVTDGLYAQLVNLLC